MTLRIHQIAPSLLVAFCCTVPALGQTTANWQPSFGAWSVASSWNCGSGFPAGCIPGSGTTATIGNAGTAILDINTSVSVLSIDSGMLRDNGFSLSTGQLVVGGSGVGTLTIQGGGIVNGGASFMNGVGSSATVSGVGSHWNASFIETGSASLNISAGGVVNTISGGGGGFLGSGNATVDGAGSQWNSTFIETGSGTLSITGGGVVNATAGDGGGFIGNGGSVLVAGSNSQWNSTFLEIGSSPGSGSGTLMITNGGVVNSGVTSIGTLSGSTGTATVSGTGSQWVTSSLCVGCGANGTLMLNAGAVGSSAGGLTIGSSPGATGTMTLTDAGTTWTNSSGDVVVGGQGTGILNVQNGATFTTSGDLVFTGTNIPDPMTMRNPVNLNISSGGRVSDVNATIASGVVKVDGIGSQWNNSQSLTVGEGGSVGQGATGQLTVSNGADVSSGFSTIGGVGSVTVTGIGSRWQNTALLVGLGGGTGGKLTISAGGIVQSTVGGLVGTSSGVGTASVTGGGSQWNLPFLQIGNGSGVSSLSIQNGGTVNSGVTSIGFNSTATAAVAGPGSALIATSLCVGCGGQATLALSLGGGGSSTSGVIIGETAGVTGSMTLTGTGTKWVNTGGAVLIGDQGTGTLNVQNGATFSTSGNLVVGQSGKGILTITQGAMVTDFNATVGAISGSNGNVLVDAGSWTNAGSLDIGVNGAGIVTLKDSGHLSSGNTTIGSHGSLMIDPSLVDISGDFALMPGGLLELDIGGVTPDLFSQLDISGFGSFQGIIDFDFIDGFAPQAGNSFDLINILGGADFSGATFEISGLQPGFLYTETFSNGNFSLVAQNDGASAAATPEPRSFWLLVTGLVISSIAIGKKNSNDRAAEPGKATLV